MLRRKCAIAILAGMRDHRLQTKLAGVKAMSSGRMQRVLPAICASLVAACSGAWVHYSRPASDEVAASLPQVIIASARAQDIDAVMLWDAVGRELGQRLDARQPLYGLDGRQLARAIKIASRDVKPIKVTPLVY